MQTSNEEKILKTPELKLAPGTPQPLGATLQENGVNFSVMSQYAEEVFLMLFENIDSVEPLQALKLNRTDNNWHIFVEGLKEGQLYGYKVKGEYNPAEGKRFNPAKLLIDPYAKALSGKFLHKDHLLFAYDITGSEKDLSIDNRDSTPVVPKSVVVKDDFDWQDDQKPNIPLEKLFIYEVHVKGFTAHPSSGVKNPGTYLGFIEKIPYLKELGVNAVELLPVHEFFISEHLASKGLTDYWGYNSIGFFAPEILYSTQSGLGKQVQEFKTLVRELHRVGIEVILDVVYNHTGEGNEFGPTLCFKGIDNPNYYALMGNSENPSQPYRYYKNDSGCGNTLNVENPYTMQMVIDSLRYWADVMHVDGFRFDLASILAKVQGQFSHESAFFAAVSNDPVLSKVKMIAEPWDLTTYQVGNFPQGWSEWNGKFRDTMRKFNKGDEGQLPEVAARLTGSADLYQEDGRKPFNSINFITCHDGFTLHDLYAYNEKHNEANMENNRDGCGDNHSWNCGAEGETNDPNILELRKRLIKNAFCYLLFSTGTPMILYGDEIMRTQKGNNNTYCQDNELTWMNWDAVKENQDIFDFVKKAIFLRKHYPSMRRMRFYTGADTDGDKISDVHWFDPAEGEPQWDNPNQKTLCFQINPTEYDPNLWHYKLFFILNSHHEPCQVRLPEHKGLTWHRILDTSYAAGTEISLPGQEEAVTIPLEYLAGPRSVVILVAR